MRTGPILIFRAAAASALALAVAHGQEVRRALPVNEPPTATAVPFDFDKASPKPHSERPTILDETGPRSAPTPLDTTVSAPSPDQVQLDFANGFYARKLYDLAAPEYEKYLGTYANQPQRASALFRLGECYRLLGNITAAKNAYETLISSFTIGEFVGPAAYRLGELLYAEKNYTSALAAYRKASVRLKDPAVVLAAKYYSARCLENLRSPAEARLLFEDIIAAKGDNEFRDASHLALAEIFVDSDHKEEALKQLEALQQETTKPDLKVEALVRAGLLKIELGLAEKGAVDLKKALQMPAIGRWQPIAEIGLLRVLYETGKYQQLLDTYEKAAKNFPPDAKPEVLLLAANSMRQLGDHKGARAIYEQITKDFSDSVYAQDAAYERLVSLYNADEPNLVQEVDSYIAQENLDPEKRARAQLIKAEWLFKQKKFPEAAAVYAELQNSKLPSNLKAEAIFKLGWCLMQTGENERAIGAFSDYLSGYPLNKLVPAALAQRAIAYQRSQNFKMALKDFNEVITRFSKAPERELAFQQKALVLGQQQDNAGMADTFKQLLKDYPHSAAAAQANYWIGWAAFEQKDYKAALPPLEAARKLDREQFFERASLRIMLAHYYLENRDALATDIDEYMRGAPKGKVPAEVLRWLGTASLADKNFAAADKYLTQLSQRDGETEMDDWLNLGRAQLQEKKYAEAAKSLHSYLNAAKQPAPRAAGLLALGQAQLGLEQYDDAQKSADEACTLQTEGKLNAQGRLLSGDIAAARGENEQASKIYRGISVIIDDPEITPKALEKAYLILKKTGDEAEAAKILNDLQTRYPEYQLTSAQTH